MSACWKMSQHVCSVRAGSARSAPNVFCNAPDLDVARAGAPNIGTTLRSACLLLEAPTGGFQGAPWHGVTPTGDTSVISFPGARQRFPY